MGGRIAAGLLPGMNLDVSLAQYLLVAATALAAGIMGGVTGYGSGLLMPLVLVPLIGAEAVVPVIGLSALMTNSSRLIAYFSEFDARKALVITGTALLPCMLTAWGYTRLTGRGALLLIGSMLILLVPLRRLLKARQWQMSERTLAASGVGFGLVVGGTSGSGIMLLSILMAAGLQGAAVIATDAGISLALGIAKTAIFQSFGALPLSSWVIALVIGFSATPGAFIAKALTSRMPVHVHTGILDGVVVVGGLAMIWQALRT